MKTLLKQSEEPGKLREYRDKGFLSIEVPEWREYGVSHGFLAAEHDVRTDSQRARLENALPDGQLLLLNQTHGTEIAELDLKPSTILEVKAPDADAWLRFEPQGESVHLGIVTADCVPVLVLGDRGKQIAAAHCGWRGATAGLLSKLLDRLLELGAQSQNLELALGPCAGAQRYEVSSEVADAVEKSLGPAEAKKVLLANGEGRFLCDLRGLLGLQSVNRGIHPRNIFISKHCTIEDTRFFSYRRQKALSGRQLSYISS